MGRVALAAVLAGLATTMPTNPAQAATTAGCGPKSATTVSRNRLVRLYFTRTRPGKKRYYACALPHGKPTLLGDALDHVLLRGRYVSVAANGCDTGGCSFYVEVTDVLRGDTVASETGPPGRARKLVASPRGEAAVLGVAPGGDERYVVKIDDLGLSEIDRGPEVNKLTLGGRTLHWLHGGEKRTAPIAHVSRCGPRDAPSVALGGRIRVYVRYVSTADQDFADYYACRRPGGKSVKLARVDDTIYSGSTGSEDIYAFVFSGDFVAFSVEGCSLGDCVSDFSVFDVRHGRRVHRATDLRGSVQTVVLTPRGQAGALVDNPTFQPPATYVVKFDSSGQQEVDRGPDLRDLTLDGNTLRWSNGSEPRSAELR
jgi:hypothetical protein